MVPEFHVVIHPQATPFRSADRTRTRLLAAWLLSLGVHLLLLTCGLWAVDHPLIAVRAGTSGQPEPLTLTVKFSTALDAGGNPGAMDLPPVQEFQVDVDATPTATSADTVARTDRPPLAPRPEEVLSDTVAATETPPPQDDSPAIPVARNMHPRPQTAPRPPGARHSALAELTAELPVTPVGTHSQGPNRGRSAGSAGTGAGTRFFDIGAKGNLFCYVVDCSSSMEEADAMGVARAEILASLEQLEPQQRFQILFYNSEVFPLRDGRQETFFATDKQRARARQFIDSQQPGSGTIHKPALLAALNMAPDVIYLLTDGETSELSFRDLYDLKRANRKRTQIHVIELGQGAKLTAQNWLERLASDHRGQYRYEDVTAWSSP